MLGFGIENKLLSCRELSKTQSVLRSESVGLACIRLNCAGCESDGTQIVVLFGCSIILKIGRNGYQLTNEMGRPWGWIEGYAYF